MLTKGFNELDFSIFILQPFVHKIVAFKSIFYYVDNILTGTGFCHNSCLLLHS